MKIYAALAVFTTLALAQEGEPEPALTNTSVEPEAPAADATPADADDEGLMISDLKGLCDAVKALKGDDAVDEESWKYKLVCSEEEEEDAEDKEKEVTYCESIKEEKSKMAAYQIICEPADLASSW